MSIYLCVREREREAGSNYAGIILYLSAENIHNVGNSPVSPATLGQTINLTELE